MRRYTAGRPIIVHPPRLRNAHTTGRSGRTQREPDDEGPGAIQVGVGGGFPVFSLGNFQENSSDGTYIIGTATPLPAALPLFATGLGALGLLGWRRKRKAQAVI